MPIYEYRCDACGHTFEVMQKFSDTPLETCELCGGSVAQGAASGGHPLQRLGLLHHGLRAQVVLRSVVIRRRVGRHEPHRRRHGRAAGVQDERQGQGREPQEEGRGQGRLVREDVQARQGLEGDVEASPQARPPLVRRRPRAAPPVGRRGSPSSQAYDRRRSCGRSACSLYSAASAYSTRLRLVARVGGVARDPAADGHVRLAVGHRHPEQHHRVADALGQTQAVQLVAAG